MLHLLFIFKTNCFPYGSGTDSDIMVMTFKPVFVAVRDIKYAKLWDAGDLPAVTKPFHSPNIVFLLSG